MTSHRRSRAVAVAALAVLPATLGLAPASASAATCAHADATQATTSIANLESATRCLVNQERTKRGFRPLDASSQLDAAARAHSTDMERQNYFSHTSKNGDSFVTRIRRTGYLDASRSWSVGENIGWGSGSYAKPSSMVQRWMNSSGHRANILKSSFRDIGVGVARGVPVSGGGDGVTFTTDFGRR